ncbi:hypothetical protein EJ04DRAFT_360098 [Polyplosphaeria fusca]|uniref:Uncharacterized protein n=1 Tax=Polyplosphaeria fusca TaxID=682080 RepID=A0A9P4QUR0_9PLEO|nr:hypothetical protein EJ04DRAFT_360098 [Polyplosphaeria fusca]
MPNWSIEAIIAFLTLLATCVPACLFCWRFLKRRKAAHQKRHGKSDNFLEKVHVVGLSCSVCSEKPVLWHLARLSFLAIVSNIFSEDVEAYRLQPLRTQSMNSGQAVVHVHLHTYGTYRSEEVDAS